MRPEIAPINRAASTTHDPRNDFAFCNDTDTDTDTHKMRPNLIAVYRVLPTELFRVNNGPIVRLRDFANVQAKPGQRAIYDIASIDGVVFPKALDAEMYRGTLQKDVK